MEYPKIIKSPEDARSIVENVNRYADERRAKGDSCDVKMTFDGKTVRLKSTLHTSDRKIDVSYSLPFEYECLAADLLEADS